MINSPLGPGFFIFFQRDLPEDEIGNRSALTTPMQSKEDLIKKDDEDILLLIQAMVVNKLI